MARRTRSATLIAVVIAAGGCNAVLGIGAPELIGSGGASGTGGGQPCTEPAEAACITYACVEGALQAMNKPADTPCGAAPASGHCDDAGACVGTCTNGVTDGSETDTDCGGGGCPGCSNGAKCNAASDCASTCCTGSALPPKPGICVSSSCCDGIQNGMETDKDCGGSECPKCGLAQKCSSNADCASGKCSSVKLCL
jgi:hypothetical protein